MGTILAGESGSRAIMGAGSEILLVLQFLKNRPMAGFSTKSGGLT